SRMIGYEQAYGFLFLVEHAGTVFDRGWVQGSERSWVIVVACSTTSATNSSQGRALLEGSHRLIGADTCAAVEPINSSQGPEQSPSQHVCFVAAKSVREASGIAVPSSSGVANR